MVVINLLKGRMEMRKKLRFLFFIVLTSCFTISNCALAYSDDPESKSVDLITGILFGRFGTGLCAAIVGGSFIAAAAGKIEYSKLVTIVLMVGGFLGSTTIINLIKGAVN